MMVSRKKNSLSELEFFFFLARSLQKNRDTQKILSKLGNKQVESSKNLISSLGVPLIFSEETKKLQDLVKERDSFPRDTADRQKAQEKIIQFMNDNKNDVMEFNFGSSFEDATVLVKGVSGRGIDGVSSLNEAMNKIIQAQEKEISELKNRLEPTKKEV